MSQCWTTVKGLELRSLLACQAKMLPSAGWMIRRDAKAWHAAIALRCKDLTKGFKLCFHFVENPFFTNTELCKERVN